MHVLAVLLQIVFKTLPGPKITRLETGMPNVRHIFMISHMYISISAGPSADRIFVSSEAVVRGFNRKGKQFLSFDTNLTEHVNTM